MSGNARSGRSVPLVRAASACQGVPMFQSTDSDDARWAVNYVIIAHLVEDAARPHSGEGSDRSDLMALTRDRLDRLYSGQTSPQDMIAEIDDTEDRPAESEQSG